MAKIRVSEEDRAYFRRLGEANERTARVDPAGTLDEVFRRMDAMRRQLGPLAEAALPLDQERSDREAARLVLRFRRERGRA